VMNLPVERRVKLRLQNVFERAEFRFFLSLERSRIVQYFAIAVPPIPGSKMPSFPFAGAILAGFSMPLL